MVFLFIPIVLTEGDHFLPSFLKSFPGFAPAEDLGMRHISFVVVASLERRRGDTLWIRYGSLLDLYIFVIICNFLLFYLILIGSLLDHNLSFCHFRSIWNWCRCSVGTASCLSILISRAEYAVRMERTWMHSVAWNSTRCDPIDRQRHCMWDSAILLQFGSGFTLW